MKEQKGLAQMENDICITIRLMNYEDVREVADIESETFSQPWPYDEFAKTISDDNYKYIVAAAGNGVVGYAGAVCVQDEADITNVAVKKQFRNIGIAKELMKQLLILLKKNGIKEVFLEVRESNDAAIALYKGYNFLSIDIRKNYYRLPTENAIVMKRTLE